MMSISSINKTVLAVIGITFLFGCDILDSVGPQEHLQRAQVFNAEGKIDEQIIELFLDVLSRDDRFEVKSASTGYDAGVLTEQFRPHLVLLDYMLPDVNGNLVCHRIRSNEDLNGTKILVISGVVYQEEIDTLLSSGADDFVKKPFNIEKRIERMAQLLDI